MPRVAGEGVAQFPTPPGNDVWRHMPTRSENLCVLSTHSRPTTPFTVFTNPLPPLRLDGHFYTFLFPIFPFTIIPTIEHVS